MEDVEDQDDSATGVGALGVVPGKITLKGKVADTSKSTEEELEREKWKNQIADHKQQVYFLSLSLLHQC